MKRNFAAALGHVLKHEGGYVNHPRDPGGATNLGVTIKTARRLGIDVDGDGDTDIVDIKLLGKKDAAKVYRHEYWNRVRGNSLPDGVDYAVFDFAVNSGVSRASKFLQRIVGVKVDGRIGPKTIEAVVSYDANEIITKLCNNRLEWLKKLRTFKTFGRGWTRRVRGVLAVAKSMASQAPAPAPKPPKRPAKPNFIQMILDFVLSVLRGVK